MSTLQVQTDGPDSPLPGKFRRTPQPCPQFQFRPHLSALIEGLNDLFDLLKHFWRNKKKKKEIGKRNRKKSWSHTIFLVNRHITSIALQTTHFPSSLRENGLIHIISSFPH
jgi:hypothetical protein